MQAVTSPVPVIGKASDQDFIIDLQIIARGEPGKGAALQRMIDRADTTQQAVADALGVSRPLVSSWCSETRVPSDVQVRNALLALKVDRKLILEFLGPVTVSSDAEFDPQATAVTIVSKLFAVDDPFEREWIIYTELWEKTLIAQGIKGMRDTRAAEFFAEQRDKHMEERRKRAIGTARNVTPEQQEWSQGVGIIEAPSTPTTSCGPSNQEDTDTYSQHMNDLDTTGGS